MEEPLLHHAQENNILPPPSASHLTNNHNASIDVAAPSRKMASSVPPQDSEIDVSENSHTFFTSLDGRPPIPSAAYFAKNPANSLVLVGASQTGKKSLAQIAGIALSMRIMDIGSLFTKKTGLSLSSYLLSNSESAFKEVVFKITAEILTQNPWGTIVIIGANFLTDDVQILLRDFAEKHLIINVMREPATILRALGIPEKQKDWEPAMRRLLELSAVYRRCSNLDFFNISQDYNPTGPELLTPWNADRENFSNLKRAERQFLKFLASAGLKFRTAHQDTFPLDKVSAAALPMTTAMSIPLGALEQTNVIDIEELEYGADAFEIFINTGEKGELVIFLKDGMRS
jgi:shikimate kinase